MGKRLAAVAPVFIPEALAAGHFNASARIRVAEVMEARRDKAIAWAFSQVTPAEVERVDATSLTLRDQANALRPISSPPTTR